MKKLILPFIFLTAGMCFAKTRAIEDSEARILHSQICDLLKLRKKDIDIKICKATGEISLGLYTDNIEINYEVHQIQLFKNNPKEYDCLVTGPTLYLEGCRDSK